MKSVIDPTRKREYPEKMEDWDMEIFNKADHFTVYRCATKEKAKFTDFAKALSAAKESRRNLLYAVTEQGRSTCLIPSLFSDYENEWNKNHPRK